MLYFYKSLSIFAENIPKFLPNICLFISIALLFYNLFIFYPLIFSFKIYLFPFWKQLLRSIKSLCDPSFSHQPQLRKEIMDVLIKGGVGDKKAAVLPGHWLLLSNRMDVQ